VVASEVRAPAQRSAEAAKQIKHLIAASGADVEKGVELVRQTGQ
jgi:methyl-accepting chemotaxis protein